MYFFKLLKQYFQCRNTLARQYTEECLGLYCIVTAADCRLPFRGGWPQSQYSWPTYWLWWSSSNIVFPSPQLILFSTECRPQQTYQSSWGESITGATPFRTERCLRICLWRLQIPACDCQAPRGVGVVVLFILSFWAYLSSLFWFCSWFIIL